MRNNTEILNNSKKKSLRNIFIVLVGFLMIITALVFIWFNQEQKPDSASEKMIREAVARKLNKNRAVIPVC